MAMMAMAPINTAAPTTTTAAAVSTTSIVIDDTSAVTFTNTSISLATIPKPNTSPILDFTLGNIDQMTALKHKLGGVFAWNEEDDERLSAIMTNFKVANKNIWDDVAAQFQFQSQFGNHKHLHKPPKECFQRWTWYLSPPRKNLSKKRFTVDEDAIIFYEVTKSQLSRGQGQGERLSNVSSSTNSISSPASSKPCWTNICKLISCSEPHRVRERWHNILNPNINHMPFSSEDDVRLYEGLKEYGQKWTLISKEFFNDTRSDIQLKNRFKTKFFQQFYAKVVTRAMEHAKRKRLGLMQINVTINAVVTDVNTNDLVNVNVNKVAGASDCHGNRADPANSGAQGIRQNSEPAEESDNVNSGNREVTNNSTPTGKLNVNDMEVEQPQQSHLPQVPPDKGEDEVSPIVNSPNQPVHETLQIPIETSAGPLAKRLKTSLAAQILNEDVPKPPPGKYFTPLGAAQILTTIGTSERRTVMKVWIERGYVPVNLTSLYRALGRYKNGLKLKPRWYCEGRLDADRVGGTCRMSIVGNCNDNVSAASAIAMIPNEKDATMGQYSTSGNANIDDVIIADVSTRCIPNPAVEEYTVGAVSDTNDCRMNI